MVCAYVRRDRIRHCQMSRAQPKSWLIADIINRKHIWSAFKHLWIHLDLAESFLISESWWTMWNVKHHVLIENVLLCLKFILFSVTHAKDNTELIVSKFTFLRSQFCRGELQLDNLIYEYPKKIIYGCQSLITCW